MKAIICLALALTLGLVGSPSLPSALAQDSQTINLPLPDRTGGAPLNEALNKRRSLRNFQATPLPLEQISQILWSAFGVNREAGKLRVIPTAHNRQDLLIFAAMANGVWLYEGEKNQLSLKLAGDFTTEFGGAPLTLVYAAPIRDGVIGGVHVGLAAQGVGLYCASAGLANLMKTTGVDILAGKLPLPVGYKIVVVHSIGQPAGNY
ncbi:MAG: nitroreductase family protein [Deltaproteobacteria bacterium]|nr:nitroreductase family protein [Deltaproteobacteria bacterium]